MRITSGTYGGRTLAVPKTNDIRPTQDRVRQALFSMLMNETPSCRFLDLFAGSGAVGLEALSRGAANVVFVELNPRHIETLRRNIATLGCPTDCVQCVRADAYRWMQTFSGKPFDLAYADPPYALGVEKGYADVLDALAKRNVVRIGGLFAAEMTSAQTSVCADGWELVRERKYGTTRLCLWQRVG